MQILRRIIYFEWMKRNQTEKEAQRDNSPHWPDSLKETDRQTESKHKQMQRRQIDRQRDIQTDRRTDRTEEAKR